jgi:hypothetical protein
MIFHVLRQKCVIEFCVKLGKSSADVRECLWNRIYEPTYSVLMVEAFRDGNKRVVDDAQSGRQSTAVTSADIVF